MKTAWEKYTEEEKTQVFAFAEEYKAFISECKTERECVRKAVEILKAHGYRDLAEYEKSGETLCAGDKVYANNRGKSLCAFVIGEKPFKEGIRLLGAHIDSPRLDLKQHPLYEDGGLLLGKTHYYGGIKKYQWLSIPMALHGVVCKKDGTVIPVSIGEDPNDPVVEITDLLVHLAKEQLEKTVRNTVEGEQLNITLGSIPLCTEDDSETDRVKKNILKILKERYDFEEEDFISAELEVVPAGPARDYGLDRSMIMGYGHDDRVCGYTSLMALAKTERPDRTAGIILVDKEEIGSYGSTSMHSRFLEGVLVTMMHLSGGFSEYELRQMYAHSDMLSNDVSAGYDPNFSSVMDKNNCAYLGRGMSMVKYNGSGGKYHCNDANAEMIARVRNLLDEENIQFQTAELGKVDAGGGGTIAYILANDNMNVLDTGVPVLGMHAPHEVASKADIYEAYRAYRAFLKKI